LELAQTNLAPLVDSIRELLNGKRWFELGERFQIVLQHPAVSHSRHRAFTVISRCGDLTDPLIPAVTGELATEDAPALLLSREIKDAKDSREILNLAHS
jgi:hypothetical protein